jgi:hypothetical protein
MGRAAGIVLWTFEVDLIARESGGAAMPRRFCSPELNVDFFDSVSARFTRCGG